MDGSIKPRRPQILILGEPHPVTLDRLVQLSQLTDLQIAKTEQQARLLIPHAEIIFIWESTGSWLKSSWSSANELKWVHTSGVGVESVLFPAMVESPVLLTNSRGYYSNSLAEFVIAAVLYFAKDIPRLIQNRLDHGWDRFLMKEIQKQSVGILGLGHVGRAVARKAKALGMPVLATRRHLGHGGADSDVDQVFPFDQCHDLLRSSDYVVNTLPLTSETRHVIGQDELRAIGPNSYFINVGRGGTVQEPVLLQALREGWIAGAALDVFETEPIPPSSEFYGLPNVLISPHCCDLTLPYFENTAALLLENVTRYLAQEPLINLVDKQLGY
jgi:phosphoglycerate dehydrogenase-like enzyme